MPCGRLSAAVATRDVRGLPVAMLRGSFGIVPQNPLLWVGSVRDNLDPGRRCTWAQLHTMLQEVQMWDPLRSLAEVKAGKGC
jgi:ABC-type multidrug transport system fused ATPase/permease subunit